MNRLQSELHRLYLARPAADGGAAGSALIDPSGAVRALVIELARPASWEVLARVWHGVQAELGLPAPAIAVSGTDGLQLWFSLAEPVGVAHARAFLEGLRRRFLPDVAVNRVRRQRRRRRCSRKRMRGSSRRCRRRARTGRRSLRPTSRRCSPKPRGSISRRARKVRPPCCTGSKR